MKKKFIFLLALLLGVSGLTAAPQLPERTDPENGVFPPFQVTLYADVNYQKPYATWTLAPGMRMLRIPSIENTPKSIVLGSRVGALLFPDINFGSSTYLRYDPNPNPMDSLIPFTRLRGSTPDINPRLMSNYRCSLILHCLDVDDILGVFLRTDREFAPAGQFYPFPERAGESIVNFDRIPYISSGLILDIVAGGAGQLSTYGTPSPKDLEITIRTPQIAEVKFPQPNGIKPQFKLTDFGIQGQISFMQLRYVGPIREQDYLGPTRVRAPGAPDIQAQMLKPLPAPVSLAGTWQSNIGVEYVFAQSRSEITWTAASLGQQGTVSIDNMAVTSQWTGDGEPGSATGRITEVDTAGAARRIEWENGVVFFRQAKPAAPAVANLSGAWKGHMGMAYQFTQNGSQFTWFVQATGEKAQGTINGDALSVSWTNPLGSGSAKGKITAKDASGRATHIDWDNGVVFSR